MAKVSNTYPVKLSAGNGNYRMDLVVSHDTAKQSIPNNTSLVNWSLTIYKTAGTGFASGYTSNWSVNIGGQTKSGSISSYDFTGTTSRLLGSGSFTITHDSSGAKSISVSGTFTDGGNNAGIGSGTASGTHTLTTIPRASSFGTITGNKMNSGITVNINRASTSFTHSMWYSFGSKTWQSIGSGIGTSVTFTPPTSLASEIPSSQYGDLTIILRTMNGSTQIGSDITKTIKLYVPDNLYPNAGTLSLTQGNSNAIGTFVKGFSTVSATLSSYSGVQGSTIKSVQITGEGYTINGASGTTGVINNKGTVTFTAKVTDSRERSSTTSASVTFLDYTTPQIISASADRTDGSGTITWNGESIKFTYNVQVASLKVGGVEKNGIQTVYFDYGDNYASSVNTSHATVISASGSRVVGNISVTNSYPVRIRVVDKLNKTSTWVSTVASGTVTLDLGKDNVGVGKLWEKGTVDAIGQMYQNNGLKVLDHRTQPEAINSTVNFNDYWRQGTYIFTSSSNVNGSTNKPSSNAGVLEVMTLGDYWNSNRTYTSPWNYVWQTFTDLNGAKTRRAYTTNGSGTGTWTAWIPFMDQGTMLARDGTDYDRVVTISTWARSPQAGFIPYNPSVGNLGSSSWRWASVHTDTLYVGTYNVTDFVIERSTNYQKWYSGKLECWGQIAHTTGITTAIGSGFRATTPSVSFPVSFSAEPILTATAFNHVSTSINSISTGSFALNLYSPDNNRQAGKINWHAVGKWK